MQSLLYQAPATSTPLRVILNGSVYFLFSNAPGCPGELLPQVSSLKRKNLHPWEKGFGQSWAGKSHHPKRTQLASSCCLSCSLTTFCLGFPTGASRPWSRIGYKSSRLAVGGLCPDGQEGLLSQGSTDAGARPSNLRWRAGILYSHV